MKERGLRVVAAGLSTLVEDLGRPGREHWGVAPSGAFDRAAHARAQRIVGNADAAAGLEVLMGGLECVAEADVVVAVTGASCPVEVGGRPEGSEVALYVPAGVRFALRMASVGARAYVAVRGGLAVPPVLGSRSRDVGASIGPAPLAPGDVLPVGDDAVGQPSYGQVPSRVVDVPAPDVLVDLVPGPHDDLLHGDGWQALEASTWVVGERSDRMGVRLARRTLGDGTATLGRVPGGLASFPVVTGSVQITPSSELVVLGPDAGVTGGYPVLGVARRKGLDELAQCRPGAPVRLRRAMRRSPGRNRGSA